MGDYTAYSDLDVWIQSRNLVSSVYELTKAFPKAEQYGLVAQIRNCTISVPSNIAEGCGRNHSKDSIQFFFIARGSLYELETQLYLSFDLNYITAEELNLALDQVTTCKKLLNGFIKYYKTKKQPTEIN